MFTVQIGSLVTCRDECAMEFALKVDRDAGGAYLGGNKGTLLGPQHLFVSASEAVTVTLDHLSKLQTNPLRLDSNQTVLGRPLYGASNNSNQQQLLASSPSSSLNPPIAHLPTWVPSLNKCDWSRAHHMKADLAEAMGVDGVSYATYDQRKFGEGISAEIGPDGKRVVVNNSKNNKKNSGAANARRQRNSVKMRSAVEKDKRGVANKRANKKKSGKGGYDDSDEDYSDGSSYDSAASEESWRRYSKYDNNDDNDSYSDADLQEEGLYNEGLGVVDGNLVGRGGSDDDGSVVDFSDGMSGEDED